MSLVAQFKLGLSGGKPTFAAAASGDTFDVGDGSFVIFKNGAGADITVTVLVPGNTVNGIATPDTPYVVPATTGEVWVRMYDYYKDPTDGKAHVTYSSTTTVTRASAKV